MLTITAEGLAEKIRQRREGGGTHASRSGSLPVPSDPEQVKSAAREAGLAMPGEPDPLFASEPVAASASFEGWGGAVPGPQPDD